MSAKPWVLYTRVSTSKQAERGASLEAQLAACNGLATAHGLQVIHVADAGESAGAVDQPGIATILDLVESGKVDGVLVYKLDRIARHTRGLLDLVDRFKRHGVKFTSVHERIDTSGAHGELIMTILAGLAQFERSQLIERIKATNDYRRDQGAWVGGAPPAGLALERRGKLRHLIPHPTHAPAVAMAWPMVEAGRSLAEVAAHLQASGVPTSMGKRRQAGSWARNTVERLVKNRTYIGMLVTADDFARAAAVLSARLTRPRRSSALEPSAMAARVWRLQGLARCAVCGSGLTSGNGTGRGGRAYPYLRCTGRMRRGRGFCAAKDLPAAKWEDRCVEALAAYLLDRNALLADVRRAIAARMEQVVPLRAGMVDLELARDRLQEQVDRALELALQGGATARAVGPRLGKLQAEFEAATVAVAAAEGRLAAVDIPLGSLEAAAGMLATAGADLAQRSWLDQQAALRVIVEEFRLGAGVACSMTVRIPRVDESAAGGSPSPSRLVEQGRRMENQAPLALVLVAVAGP